MQVINGADSTMLSPFICTELAKPQLYAHIRLVEAYCVKQLTLLRSHVMLSRLEVSTINNN